MINTCKNNNCSKKETCFRFKEDAIFSADEKDCKHYWNIKHSPIKQIR